MAHCPVTGANACADESPFMIFAGIEQVVQIHRLMGAVEVTDADVENPGPELCTTVIRPGYGRLQVREMVQVQGPAHDLGFSWSRQRCNFINDFPPSINTARNNVNNQLGRRAAKALL